MVTRSADYSFADRCLHRLALGWKTVPDIAFDLERAQFGSHAPPCESVCVLGLARAGTTALLRALHASGEFSSLTYADMPFVTAPNLWCAVSRRGRTIAPQTTRAHGDGVLVDTESPEAFEEVFWRMRCGADYIRTDHLCIHTPSADTVSDWRALQSLVCLRHGRSRYLAKNNNQVLRLASLAPQTPDAIYLVVFREPAAQAASLSAQHRRFTRTDAFTRRYMEWLVHHEFGTTHRPFRFPETPAAEGDPGTLAYWLQRWTDTYEYLLGILRAGARNLIAVEYEALCNNQDYHRRLFDRLSVPPPADAFRTSDVPARPLVREDTATVDMTNRSREIYGALAALAGKL